MAAPGRRLDHASLVTTRGHGGWQRLDALWMAPSSLFYACSIQRSLTPAAPHLQPRPITLDLFLALADVGAAAASTGTSRPKATVRACACPLPPPPPVLVRERGQAPALTLSVCPSLWSFSSLFAACPESSGDDTSPLAPAIYRDPASNPSQAPLHTTSTNT